MKIYLYIVKVNWKVKKMIRKSIMDNLEIKITIPAVLLILVFSVLSTPPAFANEGCTNDEASITKLSLDKPDDETIRPAIDTNDITLKEEINLGAEVAKR
jgi:hypothetical protein